MMGSPTPSLAALYNKLICESWDEIRDFIALHYKFNTKLQTPVWQACIHDTDLQGAASLVEFYQENGPTAIHEATMLRPASIFGVEGYLTMLVGQKVPYRTQYQPTPAQWERWQRHRADSITVGRNGVPVAEALERIRRPDWKWS